MDEEEHWVSPKSRRLSRLPVPVAGFRKTRIPPTFTASPLTESCHRLGIKDDPYDDADYYCDSPAKVARCQKTRLKSTGPSSHATDLKMLLQQSDMQESRRLSLAPRQDSMLSTPPQRRIVSRKSIAPNPYGIHVGSTISTRRRASLGCDPNRLQVCVRKRPLSQKEALNSQDSIQCDVEHGVVSINAVRTRLDGLSKYEEEHSFKFDKVFDEQADNQQVYEQILSPLVQYAADGGTSTCFAYGQTGSGKTHTMFHDQFGLCYLAAMELFDLASEKQMEVYVNFYEIYQGQLMDLLRNRRKIVACEKDGVVNILGLEEERVVCIEDLMATVRKGLLTRVTGSTGANSQSSRSHAVLQYSLRPRKNEIYGRISFIDLAGSERGADRANVSRQTKLEGSEINKSLLALKECIRAMDLDSSRIPFRQSKLTMVLRDCFLGNSRTCMIATVSPSSNNVEHSLNTLRYADRMKETQGNGEGSGEVVTTNELRQIKHVEEAKENDRSINISPLRLVQPKETSRGWSVESVSGSQSSLSATRSRLKKSLDDLAKLISNCPNQDVLDVLEEELTGLKNAFNTLS